MKKSIWLIILLIIIVLVVIYFMFVNNNEETNTNTAINNTNSSVVTTESEAITWAEQKSDDLQDFSDRYEQYGTLKSSAHFYDEDNYWHVSFWPEGTKDLFYEVHLSSNGTIIYEGEGIGG
ncbi:MAG: hypothetical protein V1853_00210 [bacterium]